MRTTHQNSSFQFLKKKKKKKLRLAPACAHVCVCTALTLKIEMVCVCARVLWACVMSGVPYVPHKFVFTPKKRKKKIPIHMHIKQL